MRSGPVFILLFLILGAALCGPVQAEALPETVVRVGVLEDVPSFNLGAESGFEAVELNTGKKFSYSGGDVLLIKPGPKGVRIGKAWIQSPARIASLEEGKFLRANGRRYRDSLLVRKSGKSRLTVINELGLDGYVYGILPREISPSWPAECLKAHAVVSRTFALRNLNRHASREFHVCARVHCQVYGGYDAEQPPTNRAVDETHNEVVVFEGDLANTVFFSNCGGRTEEPKNAWETSFSPPYLKSVRCNFCRDGGHFEWEKTIGESEIVRALRKKGYGARAPVKSIKVAGTGKSGRARSLKVRHARGESVVRASHFRMAVGPDRLRSTLFLDLKKVKGGFVFHGRGWGHGIGFCQEGARGLALREEMEYKDIIGFYYPGTEVLRYDE